MIEENIHHPLSGGILDTNHSPGAVELQKLLIKPGNLHGSSFA
jgi:hypothetical protein